VFQFAGSLFSVEEAAGGIDFLSVQIDARAVFESISNPMSLPYYYEGPPEMIHGLAAGLGQ
jgi:hypothetical protein